LEVIQEIWAFWQDLAMVLLLSILTVICDHSSVAISNWYDTIHDEVLLYGWEKLGTGQLVANFRLRLMERCRND
jgi:hypothetical protein